MQQQKITVTQIATCLQENKDTAIRSQMFALGQPSPKPADVIRKNSCTSRSEITREIFEALKGNI